MRKLILISLILILASPGYTLDIQDAKKFLKDGRSSLAVEAFTQILDKDENNSEAYYYRGLCFFNLGELNKGINDFMNAIIQNSSEHEEKIVNEIINKAFESIPLDREKALYLMYRANEFTPESKRENVSNTLFHKIVSHTNDLIGKQNIKTTEQYLSFAESYFKDDISKEVKIDQKIMELEKLKTVSNDNISNALKQLKKSGTKPTGYKKGSYKQIDLYKMVLGSAIEKNWEFDENLASIDQRLETRILMQISKSGVIKTINIEKSSGNKYLDESAKRAIMKSSPLPLLPKGMKSYDVVYDGPQSLDSFNAELSSESF